ncbi:dTDP-4-dehydrorhamnose reductase [bacterium]|nr:dTDP-4-dehydrorhamnose reductase [bacterium]
MKILITGSNGNLGTKLIDTCLKRGHNPVATDFAVEPSNRTLGKFEYFWGDVQEREKILQICNKVKPDVIIHTAAITDVDLCEQEHELAVNINLEGTVNILNYAEESGCKLVFISTDYVFDGQKGNYIETDETEPINFYGQNKLETENIIKETIENYLIIRTSSLYGIADNIQNNFLLWILKKLKKDEKVPLFIDQIVNPTLTDNLASNIFELISAEATGIYHLAGNDSMSRYEFGELVCEVFNYDKILLEKVSLSDFDFAAKRPKNSSMCLDKFINKCNTKPFGVKESLNFLEIMI